LFELNSSTLLSKMLRAPSVWSEKVVPRSATAAGALVSFASKKKIGEKR
jgi:hypothetical protein